MNEHIEQQKRDAIWKGIDYRNPEINHKHATAIQIEAWGLSGDELAPWYFTPDEIRLGLEFRARGKQTGEDKEYAAEKKEETK